MLRRSLIGIAVVAVFIAAWFAFVVRDYPVGIDSYRVVDDQTLSVHVTAGRTSWCRVTAAAETAADIRVSAACLDWLLLPGNAGGYPHELTARLAAPIVDRVVRNSDGVAIVTRGAATPCARPHRHPKRPDA